MTTWSVISQSYARYVGIPQFCFSVLGNLIVIWVFISEPTYRKNSCSFFLLMTSIAGLIEIMSGEISCFLVLGFYNDLTQTSLAWCKSRQFLVSTFAGIGTTYQCLATIDQYFITSRTIRLRKLGDIRLAHRITMIVAAIWILQGIPFLVFNEIKSGTCIINNPILNMYWSYVYFLGLVTVIPVVILVTFGSLIYRNMRHLRNTTHLNNASRQMTNMIGVQITIVVMSLAGYGAYNVYASATANVKKDMDQQGKDLVFFTVTSLSTYLNYGSSFYIFFATSSHFRQVVKKTICFCCQRQNRVLPRGSTVVLV